MLKRVCMLVVALAPGVAAACPQQVVHVQRVVQHQHQCAEQVYAQAVQVPVYQSAPVAQYFFQPEPVLLPQVQAQIQYYQAPQVQTQVQYYQAPTAAVVLESRNAVVLRQKQRVRLGFFGRRDAIRNQREALKASASVQSVVVPSGY